VYQQRLCTVSEAEEQGTSCFFHLHVLDAARDSPEMHFTSYAPSSTRLIATRLTRLLVRL
jgi:hypothetical protein